MPVDIPSPPKREIPQNIQIPFSQNSSFPPAGQEITIMHSGRQVTGTVMSYFTDPQQGEHVLVDLGRIMVVRKVSDIVS